MNLEFDRPALMPLNQAARRLRVPVGWLKGEAESGRIPHVAAGRQKLVHLPTIEAILTERAKQGGAE